MQRGSLAGTTVLPWLTGATAAGLDADCCCSGPMQMIELRAPERVPVEDEQRLGGAAPEDAAVANDVCWTPTVHAC